MKKMTIDLNSDMGEGIGNDEAIMPYISSANIACGYHAGDELSMWDTIEMALHYKVNIGAHVSFLDKENFGRSEMKLSNEEVYELVTQQLIIMNDMAGLFNANMIHVKPHGALYNMSAKNAALAKSIATAVKDFNKELLLFGLSGSHSIKEAEKIGLKTMSEVFADRSYQDDGSLTPRTQAGALIEDAEAVVRQVLQMINQQSVTTQHNKTIQVKADTICIHGDGKNAAAFAKTIHEAMMREGIHINKTA
ncbi:MAG: 5-oxoprolinase subunit PxpA [Chitinophagaceae bacterium]